ncbi:MAG: NAD(P)H-hydrate epimerase [Enterocloster sp.]
MRMLVTAKQMKAVDAHTIHTIGIPSMVLMERAALWVAEAGRSAGRTEGSHLGSVRHGQQWGGRRGGGAVMLHLKGYQACVYRGGDLEKGTEEFKDAAYPLQRRLGMEVRPWTAASGAGRCGLLIDAVFGVGLSRPIEGEYRQCTKCWRIRRLPQYRCSGCALRNPWGYGDCHGGIALRADLSLLPLAGRRPAQPCIRAGSTRAG